MTESEDIRSQISADLLTGEAEIQIGDRRIRKEPALARLEALRMLESENKSTSKGPFLKIGFSGRSF